MIMLMIKALISMMIPMAVLFISAMISKKMMNDREKSSPIECGFDPKSSARMPFALQYFLIAVIFLIFDVEIVLILPIIIIMNISSMITWTMTTMFFIMVILGGLYHEWNQGTLKWAE